MSMRKPAGPVPEPKRRRANKPESYGAAEPVVAGKAGAQPDLGFTPHDMVASMWKALENSVEGQFLSTADWERARMEMWFLNQILTGQIDLTASNWARVQNGMNELLISPADKRRAGIELTKASADPDEAAAVIQIAKYQAQLSN